MTDAPATDSFPLPDRPPRGRDLVLALAEPTFRVYIAGQLTSSLALWIQRIAQDWLVLEMTGSVALVGALVMAQFGPTLLFGMWGGVVVDRRATKSILVVTQSGTVAVSIALAVFALLGTLSTEMIFAAVLIVGALGVVGQPARQVFVGEIVSHRRLPNAISMNSLVFQVAAMAGPALGGILLPLGGEWAFLVAAVLSAVGLATLLAIRTAALHHRPRAPKAKGQIVEAFRYCRRKPPILWTLVLLVFVALIGLNWSVLLAAMADRVFLSGSTGYGLYTSALGIGALFGALVSLRRTRASLRSVYLSTMSLMVCKLIAAAAPGPVLFMTFIALSGMAAILMWTAANTLLQSSSNQMIRGRVMSLYLLISVGGQALGGPLLGWMVEHLGARWGLAVSAGVPLLAAMFIGAVLLVRNRH